MNYKNIRLNALIAAALLMLAAQGAHAAPAVNTFTLMYKQQVWPNPKNSTATFDTLLQQAIGAADVGDTTSSTTAGYNKQFSDSIGVGGARYVVLVATSAGVAGVGDTINVATFTRVAEGQWCNVSIVGCMGSSQAAATGTIASTGPINNTGKILWEWRAQDIQGGSLTPIVNQWVKWRLRSGDVRGYTAGSKATKSLTGSLQIIAYVYQ